jgi:glycosyltransferase involved in cell wall biosynthesis
MRAWLAEEERDGLDVAYVHRHFVAAEWVPAIRDSTNAKVVYSPVDLSFLRRRRHFELDGAPATKAEADRLEAEELELLESADVVHVVSTYEEQLVRMLVPGAQVRTVPIFLYDDAPSTPARSYEQRANLMFVGGFLHEPNPDGARWLIDEVRPLLRAEIPEALVLLVGSNPPRDLVGAAGDGVIVTGRVSDATLAALYAQARVIVCPLRFGAGVKGKVVEALYHGVPAVITSIAAEGLPSIEGRVLLADTAEEFAARVIEVYSNPELWNRLSQRARPYVEQFFSSAAAADLIRRDFTPRTAPRLIPDDPTHEPSHAGTRVPTADTAPDGFPQPTRSTR